ncbi:hypothetical protein PF005_g3639 [Phytophthora fragariae]|uniref:Uncharacterized protein n=1 Tax=Phytophthora fragariae TaxID=53985 RepID=A0A6A3V002_9STRA|nr:hypothetical protein PF003_g30955 [Phytophthora fragariae]KAE8946159.1 hypothetical protein PF009_g4197 [Phytophthora fragariae]KAE9131925.1 hypothetical protein PF007_g3920 [Phytophthora fragariae]KAE9132099.1 hypothetical protein PF010_g3313 [Phytophthora fragariae]KAE9152482.1 hypothetical protein PF006_g3288 [Phytophthora fragariae]
MILPWYSPPSCMCAALPPAAGAACVQCAPAGCDSVCGCGWREGVDPSIPKLAAAARSVTPRLSKIRVLTPLNLLQHRPSSGVSYGSSPT